MINLKNIKKNKFEKKLTLVIHHHDPVYINEQGQKFMSATIGRWIIALSLFFSKIILIMPEIKKRTFMQTTLIESDNIFFHSLGVRGFYFDKPWRMKRIKKICQNLKTVDVLLIRGITPAQHCVWKNVDAKLKSFLLVRDFVQDRNLNFKINTIISYFINKFRERQFKRLAKDPSGLFFSNSKFFLNEFKYLNGNEAFFAPTSVIKSEEIKKFQVKKLNDPIKILFVGRVDPLKGIGELIKSIKILHLKGFPVNLIIVGDSSLDTKNYYQLLSKKNGIEKYIHWLGGMELGPELFNLYYQSDIFILPSYSEGFPQVFWEAAANLCPAILTSVGGIPSLLENKKHSILIKTKDANAISNAVIDLVKDENLRETLIKNANELVTQYTDYQAAESIFKEIFHRFEANNSLQTKKDKV